MLGFQNRAPEVNKSKFHVKQCHNVYLKKYAFQHSSFGNSKTSIEFVASKQVRKWSRILISSLSWPSKFGSICLGYKFKMHGESVPTIWGTFTRKEGHYLEEELVLNHLAQRTVVGVARGRHFNTGKSRPLPCAHSSSNAAGSGELGPKLSAVGLPPHAACTCCQW